MGQDTTARRAAQGAASIPDMGGDMAHMLQQGQALQSAKGADGKPLDFVFIFTQLDLFLRNAPKQHKALQAIGAGMSDLVARVAALEERLAAHVPLSAAQALPPAKKGDPATKAKRFTPREEE